MAIIRKIFIPFDFTVKREKEKKERVQDAKKVPSQSNVPKVRAYCSASDHLIRKIFSGVCRDIHWFEEYLKMIEINDHFFE